MTSLKYPFYLVLGLILFSLIFGFLRLFGFPDSDWSLQKGERVVLLPGESLSQTFTTGRDGLRRIEILFGKFTLEGEDELMLELRDDTCSQILAQKTLVKKSFDSEYTYNFLFDAIHDSQNKTYCFMATFTTNRPVAKTKAPRFFIDEEAKQSALYTVTNPSGEKTPGPGLLAIRPGYINTSLVANGQEFFNRISQYKPFFLKSWFLLGLVTVGSITTFAAMIFLIREEKE